jgi:hypothetical protein
VPRLKAEGADAIVVLIHQGGYSKLAFDANSCAGMTGDIFPVLERLDPRVDLVVSGHTHNAYVCDYGSMDASRPLLLTSAGYGGTLLTDISLDIDPAAGRVVAKRAKNVLIQGEAFTGIKGPVAISDRYPRFIPEPRVAALVARYVAAAKSYVERPIGRLTAPAPRTDEDMREQVLGNLIADAQLAATAAPANGGAEIALMNAGSARVSLTPARRRHDHFRRHLRRPALCQRAGGEEPTAFSACSKSAIRSSAASTPIEMRTRLSVMPSASLRASGTDRWVIPPGCTRQRLGAAEADRELGDLERVEKGEGLASRRPSGRARRSIRRPCSGGGRYRPGGCPSSRKPRYPTCSTLGWRVESADLDGILAGAAHPQFERLEAAEQHPGGVGIAVIVPIVLRIAGSESTALAPTAPPATRSLWPPAYLVRL